MLTTRNSLSRPDEFTTGILPPHLVVHAWPDSSLSELAHHLAFSTPPLLPDPAVGTRLAFRLIVPDTRGGSATTAATAAALAHPKFMVKDLGSVVLGDGGPGLDVDDAAAAKTLEPADARRTLADSRFVVGDYVSVAILPTLSDGSVAPAGSARMGRGAGVGEAGRVMGRAPPTARGRDRDDGRGFGGRDGRLGRSRGTPYEGFGRGAAANLPMGEWRRGERLPDPPVGRGRGQGRF